MENQTGGLNEPLSVRDRGIRSYVVRSGRMTDMQKDALEHLYDRHGLTWNPGTMLGTEPVFGRTAQFVVEIGFGMGVATAEIAGALPDTCFIGLEVHAPGVGKLLSEIEARGLTNLKVFRHDATEVVDSMLLPDSVDGFHIFFPDPWPKKRHHKRRIMSAGFISALAGKLKPGGYIYFVTDWEEYAWWTLERMTAEPLLENPFAPWATREPWRPVTKFEQKAIRAGRPIRELRFLKRRPDQAKKDDSLR